MQDSKIELNKLKIIRANLFKQLKEDFDKNHAEVISFDDMKLIHEYCNYHCEISTPYCERANNIVNTDIQIEKNLGKVILPRARVALMYVNYLIENGRITEENQIEKASEFLTEIQDILSADDATLKLNNEKEEAKKEESEKIALLNELLDPWVLEHSFEQFKNKQYRDAVLNAFVALGDLIRDKTGVSLDGSALITNVLSPNNPKIILSEIESESGKNDQLGFMQIFQGSFTGIRNPKAHSIRHDLNEMKTIQYLVLASLLARRINEGTLNS